MEIKMRQIESIPEGESPFRHDSFNMGQGLGSNLTVMFGNHENEECRYLILCFTDGTRFRLEFGEGGEHLDNMSLQELAAAGYDFNNFEK